MRGRHLVGLMRSFLEIYANFVLLLIIIISIVIFSRRKTSSSKRIRDSTMTNPIYKRGSSFFGFGGRGRDRDSLDDSQEELHKKKK